MQVYLDSVDLQEIEELASHVAGLTTNPLLLKKNPTTKSLNAEQLRHHFSAIFSLMKTKPVFLQTISLDSNCIIKEAKALVAFAQENGCSKPGVKIPAVLGGIRALRALQAEGFLVLGTAIFKPEQAYYIGESKAQYLSIYIARTTQYWRQTANGNSGVELARQIMHILRSHNFSTKLLAANFRKGETEINNVVASGVDAVTVPRDVFYCINAKACSTPTAPLPFDFHLSHDLSRDLHHPQTMQALRDFSAAIQGNSAYLRMIYYQIMGRDLLDTEIHAILTGIEDNIVHSEG